jgi:hypothetical protein
MNTCKVHAFKRHFIDLLTNEMMQARQQEEQRVVLVSYLAFTFPSQKEAKFIHFEEAVRFKHERFLLKKFF